MIDMKITEEEKKEQQQVSVLDDAANYPYGLKIQLDSESFAKLGIPVPQIGQKMKMMAMVEVCSLSQNNYKGDAKEVEVSLQITDMEIVKPEKQAHEVIY